MRLYIDLVTLLPTSDIWDRGQKASVTAKRGDGDPLEVQFHRDGIPERLPLGTVVTFIVKSQGKYDQNPALVELEMGDANRPATDAGFYTGEPDYNTAPLDMAFASGDGDDTNDKPTVLGDGEVSWLYPTPGSKPKSSQTFLATIANDVKKGNEGPASTGAPTYLTAAQSDARYLHAKAVTAAIPEGQDYVDVDISALELTAAPTHLSATVQKSAAGAENLFIGGVVPTSETSVRVEFQTAAPAGYSITLLVSP